MIFNDRVKLCRLEHSFSQERVAREIGITVRNYQRLEQDGKTPSYSTLLALADLYAVSVDWLMGRTDCPEVNGINQPNNGKQALPR